MKTLGIITLFLLAIVISVGVSVYVIQQQHSENNTQRFQLVFGEIIHQSTEPSDEPGLATVKNHREPVCFKFDTQTGETWHYVSSFHVDPNHLVTTLGFEQVYEDSYPYAIIEVTKRLDVKLPEGLEKLPEGFELDNPQKKKITLEDIRLKNRLEDFDLQPIKNNEVNKPQKVSDWKEDLQQIKNSIKKPPIDFNDLTP